jgi:hypothetical protein
MFPWLPLSELLEDDAVGEALSADTDSLQNSITPQLVQNQMGLQLTSLTVIKFRVRILNIIFIVHVLKPVPHIYHIFII